MERWPRLLAVVIVAILLPLELAGAATYAYDESPSTLIDAGSDDSSLLSTHRLDATTREERRFAVSAPVAAQLRLSPVLVAPGSLADDAVRLGDDAVGAVSPTLEVGGTRYVYGDRVLNRAIQEPGPFHNFPSSFDADVLTTGTRTVVNDGYIQYTLPGSVNGTQGVFEIGTRPTALGGGELITHRFFQPGG